MIDKKIEDLRMDMAKKAIMQYVVSDNIVTHSPLIEDLKKAIDDYHDSLYTVFYSPGDFTEEQIQCIKKDLPISDMRPEATIPQGQMIIIQNKYFNPLTDTSFKGVII